jgi:hypothetical protein
MDFLKEKRDTMLDNNELPIIIPNTGEVDSSVRGLDFFDFSEEEAEEAAEKMEQISGRKDGRICICGHSKTRHTMFNTGVINCTVGKQSCPCMKVRLVVECDDNRKFMRKTEGAGALHALSQGILGAVKAGLEVKWLVEQKCDKCARVDKVSPVPVTQNGQIVDYATGYDLLLCRDCRLGL